MIHSSSIVKTLILSVAIYTTSTTNQLDNNVHSIFRQWDQISLVPIYRKLRADNSEAASRTLDAGAVMVVRHSGLWYTWHVTSWHVTRDTRRHVWVQRHLPGAGQLQVRGPGRAAPAGEVHRDLPRGEQLHTYTGRHLEWDSPFFVNYSAWDASILKISVPIIKARSWGFQNTPNFQSLHDFK